LITKAPLLGSRGGVLLFDIFITCKQQESIMPPSIFDPPPAYVQQDLDRLGVYLDDEVPDKVTDQNILIATWNIQKFGNFTKKWAAGSNGSPKRDFHSFPDLYNKGGD
jgi:hypothetical protein